MTPATPDNNPSLGPETGLRLLLTAGPTREPIDAVRFLGNRSSGKLGIALADEAARRGWKVTLLLGPVAHAASETSVETIAFESTAELEARLHELLPSHDVLVMAAAVSDYRPVVSEDDLRSKRRRTSAGMELKLEATPDLLAGCSDRRRQEQLLVGFALEPAEELEASARRKLARKRVDLIVANPLETMGSDTIDARLIASDEMVIEGTPAEERTGPGMPKAGFAGWLLERLARAHGARARMHGARAQSEAARAR